MARPEVTGVYGIDPGLKTPAFAELDVKGKLIRWGFVPGQKISSRINMSVRAWKVANELTLAIVDQNFSGTKVIGVEAPAYFKEKTSQSVQQMARCRQAIFDSLFAYLDDVILIEPTAGQAKRAVTGNHNASKEQVIRGVQQIYNMNLPSAIYKREAICDAIAIANATLNIWRRGAIAGVDKERLRT